MCGGQCYGLEQKNDIWVHQQKKFDSMYMTLGLLKEVV